jgi:integrase
LGLLRPSASGHWRDNFLSSIDDERAGRGACAKAGIRGLTFHDLRGSAVVRLALADATVPQIAVFTGHSLADVEAILDAHYLGRDAKLAEIAIMKLETRTKL